MSNKFYQYTLRLSKLYNSKSNYILPTKSVSMLNHMPEHLLMIELIVQSNKDHYAIREYIKNYYKLNVILRNKQTYKELVSYAHATCLSLLILTLIKAIRNKYFTT